MAKIIMVIFMFFIIIPVMISAQEEMNDAAAVYQKDLSEIFLDTDTVDIIKDATVEDTDTVDIIKDATVEDSDTGESVNSMESAENSQESDQEIILNDIVVIDTTPKAESRMSMNDSSTFHELLRVANKKIVAGIVLHYSGLALELGSVISIAVISNSTSSNNEDGSIVVPTLLLLGGVPLSSIGPAMCCKSGGKNRNVIKLANIQIKPLKIWGWYISGRILLAGSLGAIFAANKIETKSTRQAVLATSATLFTASEVFSSVVCIKSLRYMKSVSNDQKRLSFNIGPVLFDGCNPGIAGVLRF